MNLVNYKGILLNLMNPNKKLKTLEAQYNFKFHSNQIFDIFDKLFNASIQMHKLMPPIDRIAWDWIPTKNKLFLLEGNSNFSLLPVQFFKHKKTNIPFEDKLF